MAQAGVVLLSGVAKTRPLMDRWPLAEWGTLQGLADCDLCSLFSGSLTDCSIAMGFKDTPDEGDHNLDPNFSGGATENIEKSSFIKNKKLPDNFRLLLLWQHMCFFYSFFYFILFSFFFFNLPDGGSVIWESAGWWSSVSKLRLFLTAWRERRLVLKGDLVRTVVVPVKPHCQIWKEFKVPVFYHKRGQHYPPLKQHRHRQTPGTCTLTLSKFQQLKLGDLLLKPGQFWTPGAIFGPQRQQGLAGRRRRRPVFELHIFIRGVKIWRKHRRGLSPSSRRRRRNVVVSQTCKDRENIHIVTFRKYVGFFFLHFSFH